MASSEDEKSLNLRLARFDCHDLGNAERFRERFGQDFVYVPGNGWFAWTGNHWSREEGEQRAHRAAQETVRALRLELSALDRGGSEDTERLVLLRKHVRRSGNSNCIAALLREAQSLVEFERKVAELDADPLLLGVLNGVLEFGDHGVSFRPHARSDLITKLAPVVYDPAAAAPKFEHFLTKVQPDAEAREAFQRWYGYALTGSTAEQVLLFNYGDGSNGKSVLQELMRRMLGPYATVLPFASLIPSKFKDGSAPSPDIARLPGIRLLTTSEPEPNAQFAEGQVKQLTGGEEVGARQLRREMFNFRPQFKLVLAGNHRPKIRGTDDGIWRRIVLVPWPVKVSQDERINDLDARLFAEEASGILNWMIEGARKWRSQGLLIPEVWRAATERYRAESDPIGAFLRACTTKDPEERVQSSLLHDAYRRWAKVAGFNAVSPKAFAAELGKRGVRSKRSSVVYYLGLKLRCRR